MSLLSPFDNLIANRERIRRLFDFSWIINLRIISINVNINKMPANQYWEVWDKAPWGYTTWTHRPLGTMVLSLGYRAGVPWNETAYNNPEFDKALDDCEATLDVNERKKKMVKTESILQGDAVIPQPFWRSVFKASNKRVKGVKTHPTLYHQFQDVWLDS